MSVNAWGAFGNKYIQTDLDQVEYQHFPNLSFRAVPGVDGQPREGMP